MLHLCQRAGWLRALCVHRRFFGMDNIERTIEKLLKESYQLFDEKLGFVPFKGIGTAATHSGHIPMNHAGIGNPVVAPICLSTTFEQIEPSVAKYDYSRANNYSREALEQCIADLEAGSYCCTFSSGLATLNSIVQTLSAGDHVLMFFDVYGGTNRYLRTISSKFNVEYTSVDMRDLDKTRAALKPNTKLVWVETPSNPLLHLIDIEAVSTIAHEFNPKILVVVDNTFMSPYFQRPLDLGADVAMHSLTKYMNGHSDVIMGAAVTRDPELANQLRFQQLAVGAVPSPFDCYLVLRGLRTLPVRMREHMRSALIVARFLEMHPLVEKVIHPGLTSHPQYDLARRQMRGYSGMVSIYLRGSKEETSTFVKNLKYFYLAESLGGFESLVEVPSIMTHASVPPEQRATLGITDNLVRLSIGLEDVGDLLLDLDQALRHMGGCENGNTNNHR